jgi:predicted dehydrogenase
MTARLTRRNFLRRAAAGGTGLCLFQIAPDTFGRISPNEKLDVAVIGVANRGAADLEGVSSENIVALCDIDDNYLAAAAQRYPGAKTYNDFRRLTDQKGIDAVVVATPDHTHAVAALAALKSGRHVYCEKPLTRTVSECRMVTDTARQQKLVTQIGTQIHAGSNYRRVVELVQSGAVGPVREVHVWVNVTYGGVELPTERPPVPEKLHYDLWLGPVAERPYSPKYLPAAWRNWWAFGGGGLGDFGCHYMDLPFWALDLKCPLAIEPVDGPPVHPESVPLWMIVRYDFPARGQQPPVKLTWYHGGQRPKLLDSLLTEDMPSYFKSGVLFVGTKGYLISDYDRHVLLPEKDFQDFVRPPQAIPRSIGHHEEWIQAIKTGGKTTCSFDYSGPLTETALLGNVAYRVGQKLDWDAAQLRAANCPSAEQFIQHHYRQGWTL